MFEPIRCRDTGIEFRGRQTSHADPLYNCVAWAFGRANVFWWPDPWDPGVWPIEHDFTDYGLGAFRRLFETWGWRASENADYDSRLDKIALFVDSELTPTHLARMLHDGEYSDIGAGAWSSKLAHGMDVAHELDALCGPDRYGVVNCIYERAREPR